MILLVDKFDSNMQNCLEIHVLHFILGYSGVINTVFCCTFVVKSSCLSIFVMIVLLAGVS